MSSRPLRNHKIAAMVIIGLLILSPIASLATILILMLTRGASCQ